MFWLLFATNDTVNLVPINGVMNLSKCIEILKDDGEDWNPWGEEFEREQNFKSFIVQKPSVKWWANQSLDFGKQFYKSKADGVFQPQESYNVEIWGKAAIGLYLWEHILNGKLESKMDGVWSYGFKKVDNLKLKFRTGPGVITTKAPSDVRYLLLILNGRSEDKVTFAKMWLDFLPQFRNLQSVTLVILGNEQCHNDWLIPYTSKAGGLINTTFIVYDSPLIDNKYFFQWPLGVATYRGFPKVDSKKLDLENARPYICNFLGSIYAHSSREKLLHVIQNNNLTQLCFIKARYETGIHLKRQHDDTPMSNVSIHYIILDSPLFATASREAIEMITKLTYGGAADVVILFVWTVVLQIFASGWQPKETKSSLAIYIQSLRLSDLTLNPVGMNTECYRIYEAMSFGSVPVVENVMTPGKCGDSSSVVAPSPLRLLKSFNAPIIYINDWSELPGLIAKELKMSLADKIRRRIRIVQWYENFKLHLREQLLSVLKENISRR
ncbi:Transmembrane protein 5, partial [Stegodyphus mimosarum]